MYQSEKDLITQVLSRYALRGWDVDYANSCLSSVHTYSDEISIQYVCRIDFLSRNIRITNTVKTKHPFNRQAYVFLEQLRIESEDRAARTHKGVTFCFDWKESDPDLPVGDDDLWNEESLILPQVPPILYCGWKMKLPESLKNVSSESFCNTLDTYFSMQYTFLLKCAYVVNECTHMPVERGPQTSPNDNNEKIVVWAHSRVNHCLETSAEH